MIAGRKIKPLKNNKSHLTNDQKEIRENAEKSASDPFKKLQNSPPKYLGRIARYEYQRVSQELDEMPIRNLDRAMLELYCTWYELYREAESEVQKNGIYAIGQIQETSIGEDGNEVVTIIEIPIKTKKNPAISIMAEASSQIKSCAGNLGLTVDSRMRIFLPKEGDKPKSIFDKFG